MKEELSLYTKKWKDDSYESYMDRKKRIEEIISTQEDREFFCHKLKTEYRKSKIDIEVLTALVIPIEIAIISLTGSTNGKYSLVAVVISSIIIIGYILCDLFKKKRAIYFFEECIDIANKYETN